MILAQCDHQLPQVKSQLCHLLGKSHQYVKTAVFIFFMMLHWVSMSISWNFDGQRQVKPTDDRQNSKTCYANQLGRKISQLTCKSCCSETRTLLKTFTLTYLLGLGYDFRVFKDLFGKISVVMETRYHDQLGTKLMQIGYPKHVEQELCWKLSFRIID